MRMRTFENLCSNYSQNMVSEAEKKNSEKWQKMVKNWSKWSKLPDFDGLRTGFFFHPQRKLNLFWYHQYYSEYESGSQSKAQNLLPPPITNKVLCSLSIKLNLFVNPYETPCTKTIFLLLLCL